MNCTSARELPEGRHLIRVHPQGLRAEVGEVDGCWHVPAGWYYTDTGRARVSAAVDVWQTRVEELEGRVAAMQAAVAHPPPSALPPPAPELHPSLFLLTFLVGLLLGCCLRPRLARRLFPQ